MTNLKFARSFLKWLLILAVVSAASLLPSASSQISTTISSPRSLVVGIAVVKPSIDGVWKTGEWDDANEYYFSYVYSTVYGIAEAYLRCKYDNSSLYLLIDVPSDNGSAYTSGGMNYTGNLAIFLDLNMNGLSTSDKADPEFIIYSISNETTVSYSANEPSWSSQVIAAQKLGSSPHAIRPHRIYEISMPLQPLLQYGEHSSPENLPAINIELSVRDSFGNGLGLVGSPYLSELDFGARPVPENLEPVIPLVLVVLLVGLYKHRKRRVAIEPAELAPSTRFQRLSKEFESHHILEV
jgi:hypothetical protein